VWIADLMAAGHGPGIACPGGGDLNHCSCEFISQC